MVQSIDTKVLIVGAGFCGRAVAVNLNPADYIIIDCGEPISYETILTTDVKHFDEWFKSQCSNIKSIHLNKINELTKCVNLIDKYLS
jgi:thioredoxin reductase